MAIAPKTESVPSILRRDSEIPIQNWLHLAEQNAEPMRIPESRDELAERLPMFFREQESVFSVTDVHALLEGGNT
jgi:hypothetical protein